MEKPTISIWASTVMGQTTWRAGQNCKIASALFSLLQRPLKTDELHYLGSMGLKIDYQGNVKEAFKNGEITICGQKE